MKKNNLSSAEKKVITQLRNEIKKMAGKRIRLILFGSRARGDYDSESDMDIAIIVPGLTRKLKDEILGKVADLEIEYLMPLSTLVLSEDEFETLKRKERRLALDIEREGISL
jgi:predicted nucleotidyltransferase